MVIMSVDYGDARTGIAICDALEMLASPVSVIKETYQPKLIEKIDEIVKEKKPSMLVVGYPKNMDGSCGERAEKCREFASMLEEKTGLETKMWDERLTTVSAHKALNVTNTRGKNRKEVVDAVAAVMILEDFLKFRKNG
ncbi:MAG: Holliday junction resolvase RuvX [Clostridiales bacterium]|nr:Holliday junction resolvase RuvX [Clostridiales bacterium]